MRHVGEELGLVLAGDFELAAFFLNVLEKPRIGDCHGPMGGKRLKQLDSFAADRSAAWLVIRREHADRLTAGDHGNDEEPARSQSLEEVLRLEVKLAGQRICLVEDQRAPLA